MSLTIALPAYNEAERIGPALDELFGYLISAHGLPRPIEVLVVDDGSADATADLVRARPEAAGSLAGISLSVLTVPHGGKGAAVRAGMLAASADLVVFADADMATPPDELPRLVAALADIGSRDRMLTACCRSTREMLTVTVMIPRMLITRGRSATRMLIMRGRSATRMLTTGQR